MNHSRNTTVFRDYRVLFENGCLSGLSDGELLGGFLKKQGDAGELAFAALVERHARAVMRICRAIMRNQHDAEDAFQATFLVLATKAGRLRVRESLGPWLCAVARRISRGARATALARAARELRAAELAASCTGFVSEIEDIASVVHQEIDRLPDRYRLPILLCDLESQSHQEAARRLGWPLGTLKSRQVRAREKLRARLVRRGFAASLPLGFALTDSQTFIPDVLIRSTAQAATRLVSGPMAAETVSASVSMLVTHSLRSMIMTRLSLWVGALLTISVGVAATVLAQSDPAKNQAVGGSPSALAANPAATQTGAPALIEFEIMVRKNGAPIAPAMRMTATPGQPSRFMTTEGLVEVRLESRDELAVKERRLARAVHETRLAKEGAELAQVTLRRIEALEKLIRDLKGSDPLARASALNNGDAESLAQSLQKVSINGPLDANSAPLLQKINAHDDHEKRLADIERKLERILRMLESRAADTQGAANTPAKP
jgi:RNA polymerase sigma factor (sigma-70 family)